VETLPYMAPEQVEGREADARSDIFALGAVIYEMATGRRAFEGKSQASLIAAILERDPPPITTVQPTTPPALDRAGKTVAHGRVRREGAGLAALPRIADGSAAARHGADQVSVLVT
jgi:serine/threonine protein kinase